MKYNRKQTEQILKDFYDNYCNKLIFTKNNNNVNNKNIYNEFNNKYPGFALNKTELLFIKINKNSVNDKLFCKQCGYKTRFINSNIGYQKFCSCKCSMNNKETLDNIKKSYINKHGSLDKFYKNRSKHTKETFIKKYNVTHYSKTLEYKNKVKETKLKKYNNENFNNREKAKQTYLKNYGVDNPNKCKKVRDKIEKTLLKKHGVKCNFVSKDKKLNGKQTMLEIYGVENPFSSKEIQHKIEQTCLQKYNVKNFTQSKQYKDLYKNKEWVKNKQLKGYETKKKNGTLNASKPENKCFNILKSKFADSIHHYNNNVYPFNCDFYIPNLDLYIECHFSQYHNYKPFDINNKEHLKELEEFKLKNKEIREKENRNSQYERIIYTWTDLDVRKLKTFKENNLNYKIFYTEQEFINWFNGIV